MRSLLYTFTCLVLCCLLQTAQAQTYYSVSHINSTQTIYAGMDVTVTATGAAGLGGAGFGRTPCGTSPGPVMPYDLDWFPPNPAGNIKFSFSAPVKKIRLQFAGINPPEAIRFYINGVQYILTTANVSAVTGFCPNCNGTISGGDYYGTTACGTSSGCNGNIGGQIDITYPGNIDSVRCNYPLTTTCGGYGFNFAFASDTMPFVIQPYKDTLFCAGDSLKLAYGTSDPFKSGNVFIAQLSNASGSFSVPQTIGTKAATIGPDTIRCLIPKTQTPGTGYRVRIVSTSPVRTSPDDYYNIRIKAIPNNFSLTTNSPACETDTIRLTGNTSSTGVTWAWTGPLSYSSTNQNNKIGQVTSSMAGYYVGKATLTSTGCSLKDSQNVTVNPMPVKPTAGSNTPVCYGSTLNLNASTTTSSVTWSWTGPNSFSSAVQNPTKTGVVVADGGSYIVTATLNGCSQKDTTNVVVYSSVPTPTPGNTGPYCIGSNISLTANTITGATYNWTGPNGFTSTAQNPTIPSGQSISGGTYSVTATVNGCTSAPAGTVVTMVQGPTILAYPSPSDSICLGKPLTLVATPTNAGASATYQWLRNGSNGTGSSTGLTYYTSGVVDGDTFSIILTPGAGAPCTTPVNSNKIGIHVLQYQTPFVTISSSDTVSWPGVLINFHGTAGNAGTYPRYQWKLNGNNVQGATDSIWGATTLRDKDSVCIEVTSTFMCPSPAKVIACTAVKIATGIKDVTGDGISVYPDPFKEQLMVSITHLNPRITSTTNSSQSSQEGMTVQLVDVLGRVVYSGEVSGNKTVINTSQLPTGNYILLLTDKDGARSTWKVVKE